MCDYCVMAQLLLLSLLIIIVSSAFSLRAAYPQANKSEIRHLLDKTAKVAISTSYSIFLARNDDFWNSNMHHYQ